MLKVLAWQPHLYLSFFTRDILSSCTCPNLALELLHCLLDLPALTACLEVRTAAPGTATAAAALRLPHLAPYVTFVTRQEAGHCDTVSRLELLYEALASCVTLPRILFTCRIMAPLLDAFFKCVWALDQPDILCNLVPALLERCITLYGPTEMCADVAHQLALHLEHIIDVHPRSLAGDFQEDLLEFLTQSKHLCMPTTQPVYLTLLWGGRSYSAASRDDPELFSPGASRPLLRDVRVHCV